MKQLSALDAAFLGLENSTMTGCPAWRCSVRSSTWSHYS